MLSSESTPLTLTLMVQPSPTQHLHAVLLAVIFLAHVLLTQGTQFLR